MIGSRLSANSRRLYELAAKHCHKTFFLNDACEVRESWFEEGNPETETVGITAGASTPDDTVRDIIAKIMEIAGENAKVSFLKSGDSEIELGLDNRPTG